MPALAQSIINLG